MSRLGWAVLVLGLLAPVVGAGEGGDLERRKAAAAVDVFRKEFASKTLSVRMQALWDLAQVKHDLATKEICRQALPDLDPEIRSAAAMVLGKVRASPEVAGPHLAKALPRNEDTPEVQVAIIRAIADIGYLDARKALVDAAMRFREEEYRFVTNEVMRAFARLGDVKALPFLLQLLEFEGEKLRGRRGPLVRASSDAEAKRIYDAKYKKFAYPKGTPETVIRWWFQELVEAVHVITGEEFMDAGAFRIWLQAHAKELGLKNADLNRPRLVPKKPKHPPKDEDR